MTATDNSVRHTYTVGGIEMNTMNTLKTFSVLVLVLVALVFAQVVMSTPIGDRPIGDRFMEYKERTLEQFIITATVDNDELRVPAEQYRRIFYNAGYPAGTMAEFTKYLGTLDTRACSWKKGEVDVAYLLKTKQGTSVNFFQRKPYKGEQCLYDGTRPVLSLYCGNPIRVSVVRKVTTNAVACNGLDCMSEFEKSMFILVATDTRSANIRELHSCPVGSECWARAQQFKVRLGLNFGLQGIKHWGLPDYTSNYNLSNSGGVMSQHQSQSARGGSGGSGGYAVGPAPAPAPAPVAPAPIGPAPVQPLPPMIPAPPSPAPSVPPSIPLPPPAPWIPAPAPAPGPLP